MAGQFRGFAPVDLCLAAAGPVVLCLFFAENWTVRGMRSRGLADFVAAGELFGLAVHASGQLGVAPLVGDHHLREHQAEYRSGNSRDARTERYS